MITVCPKTLAPFYIVPSYKRNGQDFQDFQYESAEKLEINLKAVVMDMNSVYPIYTKIFDPWYLYQRVAQKILRTHEIKQDLSGKNTGFDDYVDVTKCLQQIEKPGIFNMCAQCSELPFDISTMIDQKFYQISRIVFVNVTDFLLNLV